MALTGTQSLSTAKRVSIAAASGMPRKTATLVATVEYEILISLPLGLNTRMKSRETGAKSTICRRELTATRMAQ